MFDMNPIIRQYVKEVDTQIRNGCFKVAQKYAIDINEERLVQALTDARSFYDEGYADGKRNSVVHGHYITDETGESSCSVCGEKYLNVTHNYCPNCGAKMDLEASE